MKNTLIAISLGWGVQSFALAAMSALGELPPVDVAIHADTTWERRETYEFAARWTPWLEERGVRVVTVRGNRTDAVVQKNTKAVLLPAFTRYAEEQYTAFDNDGEIVRRLDSPIVIAKAGDPAGILRRQCTSEWKILPIRRWLQAHRNKQPVKLWLGVTLDEIARMKPSKVKYITNCYPFIEMFKPPMSRWQVSRWLEETGLEIPVKSSCVFCIYHSQEIWREIKMTDNGDWEKAIAVDKAIRHKRPEYVCYVHEDRVPLPDVDLRNERDHGQLGLWDDICDSGYCFL